MPPHHLFDIATDVMSRKLHLFVEKPPGVYAEQTRQMANCAETNGVIAMVGFNRRYMPVLRHAYEMLDATFPPASVARVEYTMTRFDRWDPDFSTTAIHAIDTARFLARMLQNYKLPVGQADDLASKAKTLKKVEGAYTGELTEDGAKELLTFRGRAAASNGPTATNAKGSVKFWLKDGLLTKYQVQVQGSVSFNGNDRDVDRTTTVEIKEVGTTKVTVPDEAKKKLQ